MADRALGVRIAAVLAALGVSACGGGSSHPPPTSSSTSPAAAAGAPLATTTTTTTSRATSTAARRRPHRDPARLRSGSAAAPAPSSPPAASGTTSTSGRVHVAAAVIPCLRRARLASARAAGSRITIASDPASHTALVFVFGPYPSAHGADLLARDRGQIGIAQAAGAYVVYAGPPSNLDQQVRQVAGCLGSGSRSYGTSRPRQPVPLKPPPKKSSGKGKDLTF